LGGLFQGSVRSKKKYANLESKGGEGGQRTFSDLIKEGVTRSIPFGIRLFGGLYPKKWKNGRSKERDGSGKPLKNFALPQKGGCPIFDDYLEKQEGHPLRVAG